MDCPQVNNKCILCPIQSFLIIGAVIHVGSQTLINSLCQVYKGLMTDGQIELEVFPANPSLAAESNPSLVKLMCKPKSVGQLNILGYSTHVLGVHSQCYLKDLTHIENTQTTVEVIPPLPQITLKSSLPKSASFTTIGEGANVVASASITVFAGQSQECTLSLENVSEIPVSHLSIILDTKPHLKEFLQNVFSWSDVNIQSQLPLLQTTTLCVSVCLYGYSDFMSPEATSELPSPVYSNRSRSDSSDNKLTEALLSVEYSGTVGFDAGYCRQGSLAVTVDILPSLYIINWDVQHTDSNNNCLVMLDLENVSNHQLEITYNNNQSLIIVPQQTRRICVEISRVEFPPCPVEDVDLNNTNITSSWTNTNKPVNHYSRYLSNFIDINWAMSATKITGKVCIDHLTWTPSQLNTLQVSNTSWEVRLNEQLYLAPDIPTFTTGQIVYIKAVIFNNAGGNCEDVKLSVIPTQCTDGDTGTNSTLVTERNMFINNNNNNNNNMLPLFEDNQALTVIDSNVSFCKLLSEKDSALIVCAFVFFHPGLFTFDITCCYSNTESEDCQTWKCIPRPHVVIVD